MFGQCSSITSFPDISNWDTCNVVYMKHLFNNCSSLIGLFDISEWITENVVNMNGMYV